MMNSNNVISLVLALALALAVITAECNHEVDVLYGWRVKLSDPNNVLQSWDSTLINPCTWFHVTCNADNRVTRLDLGNAGLSGPLVPELGSLTSLQYLQVQVNNLSGRIPRQFGNLTNLVSLGLSQNQLSGTIPSSLGNLKSLRFMNLDGNNLSGSIPETVYRLIHSGNLQTLNVSDNQLAGTIRHPATPAGFRITTILQDQKAI